MAASASILVVDDDPDVRDMLDEYLSTHGFEVAQAGAGGDAGRAGAPCPRRRAARPRPAGEDGLTLARYLREHYDLGIIMVTGAGEVVDRIVGLEMGADDYVAKPFDPRELRARLKSVMRRVQSRAAPARRRAAPGAAEERIAVGRCLLDLEVAPAVRRRRDGDRRSPAWSSTCCKVFAEHPNQVLSRDRLLTLDPQPRMGAVRPQHRHSHRAPAQEDRDGPGQAAGDPHRARRGVHVRAAEARCVRVFCFPPVSMVSTE